MGYVPPVGFITLPPNTSPSAAALIREDLSRTLSRIYTTYAVASDYVGSTRARSPQPGLPRSYEEYRRQLYGEPGRDWFPLINGGVLAGFVALIVSIVVAITT